MKVLIKEATIQYKRRKKPEIKNVCSPDCVAEFIRSVLPNNSQEHFIVLHLDGNNNIMSYRVATSGLLNSTQVHPREVFQAALIAGSYSIIVAHNHPSGSVTPSKEDDNVTENLQKAGKILGIKVLDHVIVTDDNHYSYMA